MFCWILGPLTDTSYINQSSLKVEKNDRGSGTTTALVGPPFLDHFFKDSLSKMEIPSGCNLCQWHICRCGGTPHLGIGRDLEFLEVSLAKNVREGE